MSQVQVVIDFQTVKIPVTPGTSIQVLHLRCNFPLNQSPPQAVLEAACEKKGLDPGSCGLMCAPRPICCLCEPFDCRHRKKLVDLSLVCAHDDV